MSENGTQVQGFIMKNESKNPLDSLKWHIPTCGPLPMAINKHFFEWLCGRCFTPKYKIRHGNSLISFPYTVTNLHITNNQGQATHELYIPTSCARRIFHAYLRYYSQESNTSSESHHYYFFAQWQMIVISLGLLMAVHNSAYMHSHTWSFGARKLHVISFQSGSCWTPMGYFDYHGNL